MNAFLRKPFSEEMLLTTILAVRQNNTSVIYNNSAEEMNNRQTGNQKINLDNLTHISGGDNHFIKQMLTSFNYTTNRGLKEMQEAAQAEQWDTVANLAHKMLPPCRHIGAMELYSLLGRIENSVLKKSQTQTIVKLTTKSLKEFEAVSELLNEYIAKLG